MTDFHPSSGHDWSGLIFERQQSRSMQQRDMERTSLPEPWIKVIVNGVGLVMFFAFVVMVVMHG